MKSKVVLIVLFILIFAAAVFPQTTEFTYQGSLKDNASPANANYDFEFALFDALVGGSQIGPTLTGSTACHCPVLRKRTTSLVSMPRIKARRRPSGDQSKTKIFSALRLEYCLAAPPSIGWSQMSAPPPRVFAKATERLSGVHRTDRCVTVAGRSNRFMRWPLSTETMPMLQRDLAISESR